MGGFTVIYVYYKSMEQRWLMHYMLLEKLGSSVDIDNKIWFLPHSLLKVNIWINIWTKMKPLIIKIE